MMSEQELKDKVIEKIQEIFDPEIPVNIWDLGLIRRQLAEMGLDWSLPPYPTTPYERPPGLSVDVIPEAKIQPSQD